MRILTSRGTQNLMLLVFAFMLGDSIGCSVACANPQTGSGGASATADLPAIVSLQLKDTTALSSTAPNAYGPGTTCDSEGDVFFKLVYYDPAQMRIAAGAAISEITPDSKTTVEYGTSGLSASDYPNSRLLSFSVTPRGKVSALIFTRADPSDGGVRPAPEYYFERFKDDGTIDSITRIAPPPGASHWFADLISVFPDGDFLIAGTISGDSGDHPSAGSWQPFTAIYDPRGRFVSEVNLPDDVVNDEAPVDRSPHKVANAPDANPPATKQTKSGVGAGVGNPPPQPEAHAPSTQQSKPHEFFEAAISTGDVVSGPDGNIWILRTSDPLRLYAVDSSGEVVKHFQFSAPAQGLKPFSFSFAGPDVIFFDFAHFAVDQTPFSGPSEILGLFNTVSERFEGLYTLPKTQKGLHVPACGDRQGGFLYLGRTSDNHLAVFDYAP